MQGIGPLIESADTTAGVWVIGPARSGATFELVHWPAYAYCVSRRPCTASMRCSAGSFRRGRRPLTTRSKPNC